jgi:hypothetical protein
MRAITVVAAAIYEVHTNVGRACRWNQKPVQNGDRSASEYFERAAYDAQNLLRASRFKMGRVDF